MPPSFIISYHYGYQLHPHNPTDFESSTQVSFKYANKLVIDLYDVQGTRVCLYLESGRTRCDASREGGQHALAIVSFASKYRYL